jgi:hypothetical protein
MHCGSRLGKRPRAIAPLETSDMPPVVVDSNYGQRTASRPTCIHCGRVLYRKEDANVGICTRCTRKQEDAAAKAEEEAKVMRLLNPEEQR